MAPGNPSCLPLPLSNTRSANYKELISQFTANAPQPYGFIPPRKKRSRATSLGTKNSTARGTRPSLTASRQSRSSMELMPTTTNTASLTSLSTLNEKEESNAPSVLARSSLVAENADHSTSTRLGFWANLKAQYLATTKSFSWSILAGSADGDNSSGKKTFQPPSLTNPSPAGASTMATVSFSDALLSLPNLATSHHTHHQQGASYPLSVAAIDRLKPLRTDTIPLKTFTYHETPAVERPRPPLQPCPASLARRSSNNLSSASAENATMPCVSPSTPPRATTTTTTTATPPRQPRVSVDKEQQTEEPLPLPRHLATRETRSNTDYLRMMAAELRMIRSRKLVSPLKPRGYLPRRKDPFRIVKTSLSTTTLPQDEDDYHPLNDVLVGSWSSTCSTVSFLSTKSSDYLTANESF
ncbi:hypothetical protein DFQ27_001572 [Actinomortierella ambigua]|uniref:Uncharacterized protein n=1 Tax=Actinomortierella ambigua TaxID=1343610 RepID=A0A9P6U8A1_9FUNG|nr:hypothetical protein DFQ27_001572 [Actinomortierella ambigua]